MEIVKTIKEFILEINKKKPLVIYGAGEIGKLIFKYLKSKGIMVTAFTVTMQAQEWEWEGITVCSLDDIINCYESADLTIILAVTKKHQSSMEEELKKRNISSYIKLSDTLLYELEREKQKSDAREAELKKKVLTGITVGFLSPGYFNTDYAEKRLVINRMRDVSYVAVPKETPDIVHLDNEYEDDLETYKQLAEACYCPKEYIPEVDLIHTFNIVCDTNIPWCASFESAMPRVWPRTEAEKNYYLQLVSYMRQSNCRALYALCKNAYDIQLEHLKSYASSKDVKALMEKTKVLHPPQNVLITEKEFEEKHDKRKLHFIFIGRGFFFKGGREIIKALSKFENQYDFSLTLISSLIYNDYFTKTSKKEMLNWKKIIQEKPWIDYYESLPNDEVLEKCKEATIGLLPSVADTYGYSVLEMQASGCPVITTNIRAFPEINNEECGWICRISVDRLGCCSEKNWSDVLEQELKRCFLSIFEHPDTVKQKGHLALKRIREMHDPDEYQKELRKNLVGR